MSNINTTAAVLNPYTLITTDNTPIGPNPTGAISIDDTMDVAVSIVSRDPEPYEDWLMRMIIEFGVGNPIPAMTYNKYPYSKRLAAKAIEHTTTGNRITEKAKRYLEAVEIMKAREQDGSGARGD